MANKTGERKQPTDKMNLYVNGRFKIQVDTAVAHNVAATYMDQGDTVWLSRSQVNMSESNGQKYQRKNKRRV